MWSPFGFILLMATRENDGRNCHQDWSTIILCSQILFILLTDKMLYAPLHCLGLTILAKYFSSGRVEVPSCAGFSFSVEVSAMVDGRLIRTLDRWSQTLNSWYLTWSVQLENLIAADGSPQQLQHSFWVDLSTNSLRSCHFITLVQRHMPSSMTASFNWKR